MDNKNKRRLGKIYLDLGYVVDLDDAEMVIDARSCIIEDIYNAVKYNELENYLKEVEDKTANEDDISEFLLNSREDLDNDLEDIK